MNPKPIEGEFEVLSESPGHNNKFENYKLYRVFGETIASDYPLSHLPEDSSDEPSLSFSLIRDNSIYFDPTQAKPIYIDPYIYKGEPFLFIYRLQDLLVVHFPKTMDFYISEHSISAQILDPAQSQVMEIYLFGTVFSLFLEQKGIPALHASAVEIDGQAAAFLSVKESGKSTLAACLVAEGCPLISDDVLPVELSDGSFLARPGYPQMRMWPEMAMHFLGHYQELELVDETDPCYDKRKVPLEQEAFGSFSGRSRPLAVIYLPQRQAEETSIRIEPVSPRDGIVELVRYSFPANIVEALGLEAKRFGFFAQMMSQIPMRRLIYPSGFQNLARVKDAILKDMESLSSHPGQSAPKI